ncbi:hypothetical protein SDC9_113974 [bioreactor metagenome]|uniref:Uncharacterized protein n=1 Tax=bioreactor metagenome TaxID=1076179 RepID=A0A645BPK5_9ZZZZ
MKFQLQAGDDPAQVFAERIDLPAVDLVGEEKLAVQIALRHPVEIGDHQFPHAGTDQMHRAIRTQPSGSGDADDRPAENIAFFRGEKGVDVHLLTLRRRSGTHSAGRPRSSGDTALPRR